MGAIAQTEPADTQHCQDFWPSAQAGGANFSSISWRSFVLPVTALMKVSRLRGAAPCAASTPLWGPPTGMIAPRFQPLPPSPRALAPSPEGARRGHADSMSERKRSARAKSQNKVHNARRFFWSWPQGWFEI